MGQLKYIMSIVDTESKTFVNDSTLQFSGLLKMLNIHKMEGWNSLCFSLLNGSRCPCSQKRSNAQGTHFVGTICYGEKTRLVCSQQAHYLSDIYNCISCIFGIIYILLVLLVRGERAQDMLIVIDPICCLLDGFHIVRHVVHHF